MRISRPGGGLFAALGVEHRRPGPDDDGERIVRRLRLAHDVARIDVRRRANGTLLSVTIASETTRPLSSDTIDRIVTECSGQGATVFRTPAITSEESAGYRRSGFTEVSTLRLLTHDADTAAPIPRSPQGLRRASANALSTCAEVDRRAFGPEQCFDRHDLAAALDATDRARLRVAERHSPTTPVAAFAVTGRAGRRGYLQRLAVDPTMQGQGLGTALVLDALRWCHRHGARRVVVNTSTENTRALSLYRNLGFVDTPLQLLLMERRV
jgi:ribosomal protein S18 acetylase RimI-like enzyme